MNDEQVKDALRGLGGSGIAPDLQVGLIVADAQARRRRRYVGAGVGVLVLLAAPYTVWAATQGNAGAAPVAGPVTRHETERPASNTGSTPTTGTSPAPAPMAPACPPASPLLVQDASPDAAIQSQPARAAAGGTVTFNAAQKAHNAPDRPIVTLQLIVARPEGEWTAERHRGGLKLHGLSDLKRSENQIAASRIVTSPGGVETLTMSVPATTAPGRYPVYIVTTWPGPSLCGHTNKDTRTPQGSSWGRAGTLVVTPAPR